jgi:hypothetical protein
MASAPQFKVYKGKEYIAACKYAEDAAVLVAASPDEMTIRHGHTWIVWTEGKEAQPASESYDFVANTVNARVDEGYAR